MKSTLLVFSFVITFLSMGCSQAPRLAPDSVVKSKEEFESHLTFIEVGVTTRRKVHEVLGKPYVEQPNELDAWFHSKDSYTWWSVPEAEAQYIKTLGLYESRSEINPQACYGSLHLDYDPEGVVNREYHYWQTAAEARH